MVGSDPGYRVMVNGTAGRAELEVVERGAVLVDEHGRIVLDPSAVTEGGTTTCGRAGRS